MRASDLKILRCPNCTGSLLLTSNVVENGNVASGFLSCPVCSNVYPIMNHVCVFLSDGEREALLSAGEKHLAASLSAESGAARNQAPDQRQMRVGLNWEYQFADVFPVERQMLENPDGFWGEKAFFRFSGLDKALMDGMTLAIFCGGSGREAWHLCRTNAQRIIVLDLGGHIGRLPTLLVEHLDRLLLIRCDALRHPLKDGTCAIAICDHALQHIPDHVGAYRAMAEVVASGGVFSICVYSYENNWPMTHIVEPAKRILHFFSIKTLRFLALVPAGMIWLYQVVLCSGLRFLAPGLAEKMPWSQLFSLWLKDGFEKIWEACFDLLHAPVSYHFRQAEVARLAKENGLQIQRLELMNRTMWTMVAEKP